MTGAYGDKTFTDEFIWAAAELSTTTNDLSYLRAVDLLYNEPFLVPSWNQVKLLGYYTLLKNPKPLDETIVQELKTRLVKTADDLIAGADQRTYNTVMGGTPKDFVWGSSAVAANQGILLMYVYRLTKK